MPILSQECHNYSSILVTGGKSILLNIVTIMAMTRLPLFIDYCHNISCWRGALRVYGRHHAAGAPGGCRALAEVFVTMHQCLVSGF